MSHVVSESVFHSVNDFITDSTTEETLHTYAELGCSSPMQVPFIKFSPRVLIETKP